MSTITHIGRRVPLEAMQYQATEGVQHKGCSISPWRYNFFETWKQDPKASEGHGGGNKETSEDQDGKFQETEIKGVN